MLTGYPKTRNPLPPEYKRIYDRHYLENRNASTPASGLAAKMETWMHRQVARDIKNPQTLTTLELGAGSLNHLPYESGQTYDIVEPYQELLSSSTKITETRSVYKSVFDIQGEEIYDRIISIAVLEHLLDLPAVVAKCGLLMKEDGGFRAGIPNEGTILWKLGYELTTGLEFRQRYNLDYSVLMRHEHVNTADEIEGVLKYFFGAITCKVFGISRSLGFYRFYACSKPDKDTCREYVGS